MQLYAHQKAIIARDPLHHGLWLGTGSSKTRTALEMAQGRVLIVVPKQQRLDKHWEKENKKFNINKDVTVISKEEFRRDAKKLPKYDTLIVDESHYFFSGLQPDTRQVNKQVVPKTSQMFDALMMYIKKHKPERMYFLTATPASKPMNVYAIAKLFGKTWDFYQFRSRYYIERKMGYRSIWIARSDQKTKDELITLLKRFGTTGQLSDFFDVPEQTYITEYVAPTAEQKRMMREVEMTEADPMVKRTKLRQVENGILYSYEIQQVNKKEDRLVKSVEYFSNEKMDYILERASEFKKMLIFAVYTAQVHAIAEKLREKGYNVSTLTGDTKDRGSVVSNMEQASEGILVAQSGISSGYELKKTDVVIFASLSPKVLDTIQGQGRVLRSDALKKNLYIYLVMSKGVDEQCYKSIMSGVDFNEKLYD